MRVQPILRSFISHRKYPGRAVWILVLAIVVVIGGVSACTQGQEPKNDPVSVVERHLEAKKYNNFEMWKSTLWAAQQDPQNFNPSFEKSGDLGVISLSVQKVAVSDEETKRIQEEYTGSDLAKKNGWSDEYIAENMTAVVAQYTVDYDNTKVPYDEGSVTEAFYLIRKDSASPWLIWDTISSTK